MVLFVDELAFLLVGLERETIEFEKREVIGCRKRADASEMVEPDYRRRRGAEPVLHFGEEFVDFSESGGFARGGDRVPSGEKIR